MLASNEDSGKQHQAGGCEVRELGSTFGHLLLAASSSSCGGYRYAIRIRTKLQVGQTVENCTTSRIHQLARRRLRLVESSGESTARDGVVIESRGHGVGCNTRASGDRAGRRADRHRNHAKRNTEFEMALHCTITQIDTIPSSSLQPWGVLSRMSFPAYVARSCNIDVTVFISYAYNHTFGRESMPELRFSSQDPHAVENRGHRKKGAPASRSWSTLRNSHDLETRRPLLALQSDVESGAT